MQRSRIHPWRAPVPQWVELVTPDAPRPADAPDPDGPGVWVFFEPGVFSRTDSDRGVPLWGKDVAALVAVLSEAYGGDGALLRRLGGDERGVAALATAAVRELVAGIASGGVQAHSTPPSAEPATQGIARLAGLFHAASDAGRDALVRGVLHAVAQGHALSSAMGVLEVAAFLEAQPPPGRASAAGVVVACARRTAEALCAVLEGWSDGALSLTADAHQLQPASRRGARARNWAAALLATGLLALSGDVARPDVGGTAWEGEPEPDQRRINPESGWQPTFIPRSVTIAGIEDCGYYPGRTPMWAQCAHDPDPRVQQKNATAPPFQRALAFDLDERANELLREAPLRLQWAVHAYTKFSSPRISRWLRGQEQESADTDVREIVALAHDLAEFATTSPPIGRQLATFNTTETADGPPPMGIAFSGAGKWAQPTPRAGEPVDRLSNKFVSVSLDFRIANSFAGDGRGTVYRILIDPRMRVTPVWPISEYPVEAELLVPPGYAWRAVSAHGDYPQVVTVECVNPTLYDDPEARRRLLRVFETTDSPPQDWFRQIGAE